jgi:hypothetical protein
MGPDGEEPGENSTVRRRSGRDVASIFAVAVEMAQQRL